MFTASVTMRMIFVAIAFLGSLSLTSANRIGFLRSSLSLQDDNDYNHLMTCMWNGTNPAFCHQLDCVWCRSTMFSLCVTETTASNMGGSVFLCEGAPPDDDATTKPPCPCNDDCNGDDKPPAPIDDTPPAPTDDTPPAPIDDAPPAPMDDTPPAPIDDFWVIDDTIPVTDDAPPPAADDVEPPATDDGGPSEKKYMADLLACLTQSKDGCGLNSTSCVWCINSLRSPLGLCLSDEAATNMQGALYTCDWPTESLTTSTELRTLNEYETTDTSCSTIKEAGDCNGVMNGNGAPCQWCEWDSWGGVCLEDSQFDMINEVAPCEMVTILDR